MCLKGQIKMIIVDRPERCQQILAQCIYLPGSRMNYLRRIALYASLAPRALEAITILGSQHTRNVDIEGDGGLK